MAYSDNKLYKHRRVSEVSMIIVCILKGIFLIQHNDLMKSIDKTPFLLGMGTIWTANLLLFG